MLRRILASSDWKQLSAFVTPAFFDVISVRRVLARANAVRLSRNDPRTLQARQACAERLRALPLSVALSDVHGTIADDRLGDEPEADAARVVTLYFAQLFGDEPTLLDLRESAFSRAEGRLTWSPAAWVCDWDPAFIAHLRDVYRGFYEDDDARFRRGLQGLGIEVAADTFRKHFQSDQQHHFVTSDFLDTFSEVFRRCSAAKIELHPDFALLGIYLAALYDCLDGKAAVDVRACYSRAVTGAEASQTAPEFGSAHA